MEKEVITFRLDSEKKSALDAIAESLDRDRSFLINEAIATYLEVHQWQLNHIREGLGQADNEEFATDEEVGAAIEKFRK